MCDCNFLPVVMFFTTFLVMSKDSVQARPDKSYVATIKQPFGKVRLYSDGDNVVTAFFDKADDLIFCHPSKDGKQTAKTIFQEAIEGKSQRDKMVITMDVSRHARRCTKFLKDVGNSTLEKQMDSKRFKTAKMMLELYYGVPGTNWCRFEKPVNITRRVGKERDVDRCCRRLHRGCSAGIIPGHTRQFGLYNYYPWPLYHCKCTYTLHKCLSNLENNPLAKHVGELIFNYAQLPCFRFRQVDKCVDWKPWFTKCKKTEHIQKAHRRPAKHFKIHKSPPPTD